MKIDLERSGGIAGITKTIAVDTNDLPEHIRKKLEAFFSLSGSLQRQRLMGKKKKNITRDCYSYKLSAYLANKKEEVVFGELDIDKALRSAIRDLFVTYKG